MEKTMNDSDIKLVTEIAEKATKEWITKNKPKIGAVVTQILDKRAEEIVGKLLGFDIEYDGWKVDHCNGRAGESAAGDWFRQRAGESVNKWLSEQAGNLPELPKDAVKALRKAYLDRYTRLIEEQVWKLAERNAAVRAHEIIKQVTGVDAKCMATFNGQKGKA